MSRASKTIAVISAIATVAIPTLLAPRVVLAADTAGQAADGAVWYYIDAKRQLLGPVNEDKIRVLIAEGRLRRDVLVCRKGEQIWRTLKDHRQARDKSRQIGGEGPPARSSAAISRSAVSRKAPIGSELRDRETGRDLIAGGWILGIGGGLTGAVVAVVGIVAAASSPVCIMDCRNREANPAPGFAIMGAGAGVALISAVAGALMVRAGHSKIERSYAGVPTLTAGITDRGATLQAGWTF